MNQPVQEDENSLLALLNEFLQVPPAEVDTVQPAATGSDTQHAEPIIVSTIRLNKILVYYNNLSNYNKILVHYNK